ncbi:MAG: peptidylprolyl isomerase [Candidatus Izimaplasma sp.]|nr:peptidylprolyl isomerase [Candidatus Izimaplasma bacterium]
MKKLFIIILTITIIISLTACNEKADSPDEIVHTIPSERAINIQDLSYAKYLNLDNPIVTITVKDMGEIKLQLFKSIAPNTVNNFIVNIQNNLYDENQFHRVIQGFMIQGGAVEDPSCSIEGEFLSNDITNELKHYRGVISMARTNDLNSAATQFFLVHANSHFLDENYAGFGGVISGFNIIDYISTLQVENTEQPSVPVVITSIEVDLRNTTVEEPICYQQE